MTPYFEQDGITIYHGHAEEVLPSLPAHIAALSLNDGPYFRTVSAWWDRRWRTFEQYLDWVDGMCIQWKRTLQQNGSFFFFAKPKRATKIERVIEKHFNVLQQIVWDKTGDYESGDRRATAYKAIDHESLTEYFEHSERVIFAEQRGAASLPLYESIKQKVYGDYLKAEFQRAGVTQKEMAALFPSKSGGITGCVSNWLTGANEPTTDQYERMREYLNSKNGSRFLAVDYATLQSQVEAMRRPFNADNRIEYTDVWHYRTVPANNGKHECEKPLQMYLDIIGTTTKPGDLVIDSFCGSGVALEAAQRLGRRAIGIDVDLKWVKRSASRIGQGRLALAAG